MRLPAHRIPPRTPGSLRAVLLFLNHPQIILGVTTALCKRDYVINLMESRVVFLASSYRPLSNHSSLHVGFHFPFSTGTQAPEKPGGNCSHIQGSRREVRFQPENEVHEKPTDHGSEKFTQVVDGVLSSAPKAEPEDQYKRKNHIDRDGLIVVEDGSAHSEILPNLRSVWL